VQTHCPTPFLLLPQMKKMTAAAAAAAAADDDDDFAAAAAGVAGCARSPHHLVCPRPLHLKRCTAWARRRVEKKGD